jgi:hypothetical protein
MSRTAILLATFTLFVILLLCIMLLLGSESKNIVAPATPPEVVAETAPNAMPVPEPAHDDPMGRFRDVVLGESLPQLTLPSKFVPAPASILDLPSDDARIRHGENFQFSKLWAKRITYRTHEGKVYEVFAVFEPEDNLGKDMSDILVTMLKAMHGEYADLDVQPHNYGVGYTDTVYTWYSPAYTYCWSVTSRRATSNGYNTVRVSMQYLPIIEERLRLIDERDEQRAHEETRQVEEQASDAFQ